VKTKLRIAVEDPWVASRCGIVPDNVITEDEPFFLDGPVAERVAVVDRDPETGRMAKPVSWVPKGDGGVYSVPEDISSPQGIAASVFGIVLETLQLFERADVLGHKVRWAFDAPQLLIVPRAGTWANAFYDRFSKSLQCFSFDAPDGARIHTALSRDIIAHETGHAVLDGLIKPLYDALNPQTLALHESIGDLTAIVMALRSSHLRDWLIEKNGGQLAESTPVSQLAVEFGQGLGYNRPLRDAWNDITMGVGKEPHNLSQVLTGALWKAMVQLNKHRLDDAVELAKQKSAPAEIGKALGVSALMIGRILFRALDYLVPAEATFADYGRAILASDEDVYPDDETGYRAVLIKEFKDRGVISSAGELEPSPGKDLIRIDLNNIKESEWAAYDFAEKNRRLLKIPKNIPFRLLPRQEVNRLYFLSTGERAYRKEMILRVTWEKQEENVRIPGMPSRRAVFMGTTAVFEDKPDKQERHRLISCLSTDVSDAHIKARDETIRLMVDRGQLETENGISSLNARPLSPVVFGRITDNVLRLRGTARLLHLAGIEE
jgi:hypothetical protein